MPAHPYAERNTPQIYPIHILTKTYKTLLESLALRALRCYRHPSARKYTSTSFLPLPPHVYTDIKNFQSVVV